jgi:glycerophosphoryl diester phosphodiesterase
MQILSHRGCWKRAQEQNTARAFARSFARNFGTETDLRDHRGALVVAHDPANDESPPADLLFEIYSDVGNDVPLALNVKADGLQPLLRRALDRYGVTHYFLFDMSVPDALASLRAGLRVFTRHSEAEPEPAFYREAAGVWLDGFHDDWFDRRTIERHLGAGKQLCVVSPELHGRDHRPLWDRLADWALNEAEGLMLCTDHPEEAARVFHGDDPGGDLRHGRGADRRQGVAL